LYKRISDYGVIGDLRTVALVGLDGSIDWLCLPQIDSSPIFCALLDDAKGGSFSISPETEWDSTAHYESETNILCTRFRTRTGVATVTDFMTVPLCGEEERESLGSVLYRRVEVEKGRVAMRVEFAPTFDYARHTVRLEGTGCGLLVRDGDLALALTTTRPLTVEGPQAGAVWEMGEGERVWLRLGPLPRDPRAGEPGCSEGHCPLPECVDAQEAERVLEETRSYWRGWLATAETGRSLDTGLCSHMVNRSALVLKLLYYNPTGAIAAAATTSLPEEIGGTRNWDYRFTWLRDASFTLRALFEMGHLSETEGYLRWIEGVISRKGGAEAMRIMYGLRGEEDLEEVELTHLDGYKGSRPVRVGNGAADQKQLDIYGSILDAALGLADYVGKIDATLWPFLRGVCDYVATHWQDRDNGIWEVRGGPYHFVYSKVMCWVALDRGMTIADRYGFPADKKNWQGVMEAIRAQVLDKGFNREKQAFVQHYETDALDATALLIPALGFLPFDDPRVLSTMEAVQRELGRDGFLYRYRTEDGIEGGEGAFLLCTFWLADCFSALGRTQEATALLRSMEHAANHLGLFSEEYDPEWRESLGNFPQAFTHIGYINSAVRLIRAEESARAEEQPLPQFQPLAREESLLSMLLSPAIRLNQGEPERVMPPGETARLLKQSMNQLRGAFFDTKAGRVAYERMGRSDLFREFTDLSRNLQRFDPATLQSREERTAFWINVYNVMVIHGVIELGVRDSIKEVRNFLGRVTYVVGGNTFSAEEVEHGILRANSRPPNALFRPFSRDDARLDLAISPVDPRVHFALVCASTSCPPIEVYTPERLDEELDMAAKSFLNGGGIEVDRSRRTVSLSRIFSWYADDFGETMAERLHFAAGYLYDEADREYLMHEAGTVVVLFQEYDWRLNRSAAPMGK
jgi:GH15 family glucan-1,4-alpha-glucosidase